MWRIRKWGPRLQRKALIPPGTPFLANSVTFASLGVPLRFLPLAYAELYSNDNHVGQARGSVCHMITGDNWVTARMIANGLGIRHVTAEVRSGLHVPRVGCRDQPFCTMKESPFCRAMAILQNQNLPANLGCRPGAGI